MCVAASERSRERSSCIISSVIELMETLSGDVSMEVVKFEFSADSRNLHCRTRSRDSTSEVARDRNVRALR